MLDWLTDMDLIYFIAGKAMIYSVGLAGSATLVLLGPLAALWLAWKLIPDYRRFLKAARQYQRAQKKREIVESMGSRTQTERPRQVQPKSRDPPVTKK